MTTHFLMPASKVDDGAGSTAALASASTAESGLSMAAVREATGTAGRPPPPRLLDSAARGDELPSERSTGLFTRFSISAKGEGVERERERGRERRESA